MNRRLIISLLCAGALAFACGPRLRTQAPAALASALPVPSHFAGGTPIHQRESRTDTKLDSHVLVNVAKHSVRFGLQIKNVGRKHVELTFPNGQAYDFVVLDGAGREIWRWSTGRMFTQGIQNRLLGEGESMNAGATWTPGAINGRYTVVATLKSSNFPTEERSEFALPSDR